MIYVNHTNTQQESLKSASRGDCSLDIAAVAEDTTSLFAALSQKLRCDCIAVAAILPRGDLELVKVEFSCFDRRGNTGRITDDLNMSAETVAWAAIHSGNAVQINGIGDTDAELQPQPFIAGAYLKGPIFDGYPGVLLAYRGHEDRKFSAEDLTRLTACATETAEAFAALRRSRVADDSVLAPTDLPVEQRFVALTADRNSWSNPEAWAAMDETLQSNLLQAIAHITRRPADEIITHDVTIEDSSGLRRRVRIVVRPLLPLHVNGSKNVRNGSSHVSANTESGARLRSDEAVEGPQILCCFTPPLVDWMRLRSEDVMANTEMMRLVPSIQFMTREVDDQPGLNAIAQSVNLSPFHFHRRFTELFGVTPKYMLLTTQIAQARRLLAQADHPLAEIARVCGFAHQSHFTSRFKQATGLTPTRWRRLAVSRTTHNCPVG